MMETVPVRRLNYMTEQPIHNERRDYRKRMRWAIVLALAVHAVLFLLPMNFRGSGPLFIPPSADEQPVVVALQPTDEPQQLIAPGAPADTAPSPATDLIAERASKAQDMTPGDTGGATPDAGAVGPVNDVVTAPAPPPAPSASPGEVPVTPIDSAAPKPEEGPRDTQRPPPQTPTPAAPTPEPLERVAPAEPAVPGPPEAPRDAAIQLAKADTPNAQEHTMGTTQSQLAGGVTSQGFLSFEAKQSEFAPYLRTVRDRVEKRWKAIMHVRYSGATTVQAVVDCAIAPDGKLDRVAIVEPGASATFAGLCKQAIEQAGPFGPFPFQVPDVYQSRNIEIRWTFSFL